jgi:hypothetical protein
MLELRTPAELIEQVIERSREVHGARFTAEEVRYAQA